MTFDKMSKEMASDISSLAEGEFGEVIFDRAQMENLPTPDVFLHPAPDVMEDWPSSRDNDWWDDLVHVHPYILGLYIPMRSPGQVVLFGHNLRQFYWSLVHHVVRPNVPYLTKLDLAGAWKLVLMKTLEHEIFHHDSDVLRTMFGTSLERDTEEALAVAWARFCIQDERSKWQSQIGRMNGLAYSLLMREAFRYRSPGYQDWGLYADEVRFKPAWLEYLKPGSHMRLQQNGVEMERLVYGMIGQVGAEGYVEKLR